MPTLKKAINTSNKASVSKKAKPGKITKFRPAIRSRHKSHDPLRTRLTLLPFRSVVRLGSTTEMEDTIENGGKRVELNTTEAIKNSASKTRMKACFIDAGVKTAPVFKISEKSVNAVVLVDIHGKEDPKITVASLKDRYPLIAKPVNGSRGRGIELIEDSKQFDTFLLKHRGNLSTYIIEDYLNYVREYRLHVDKNGCFYTCRKVLKNETPKEERFFRNDSNCNWILDTNPLFDKPTNWKEIEAECVKALKAVGLDFGACDIRVQSAKTKGDKEPKFFIVEINSAPSFGEKTLELYLERIPKMLREKHGL